MSIRYNNGIVAGKYKSQTIYPASENEAGIIQIATSQEVKDGTNNTKAVTPRRLKSNYASKEELQETNNALSTVESIAKGAQQAISFANYQSMVNMFNSYEYSKFNIGQNIMIQTLEVPDLWINAKYQESEEYTYTTDEAITEALKTGSVRVGRYELSALETGKIDLTDYVTQEYLQGYHDSTKQDKLTAGSGIDITNNIISNTQTSAEWGNIQGELSNQTDLQNTLDGKQDVISDLETIRTNAKTGADLAPQVTVNTQRIEDLTVSKFPNATPIGKPQVQDSYVSGFSDSIYMIFPFTDISRGLPFDIYFSFTTDEDVTTQQNILDSYFGMALAIQNGKGIMALSSNGTNWDIGTSIGTNTLLPRTTYYAKYSWTGTEYTTALSTDSQSYFPDMQLTSSLSPHKTTIYIGGSPNLFGPNSAHPFKGTINFKGARIYLPTLGIDVWQGMADIGLGSRANVSLNNLDEVGEGRFNSKQDVITDLETIRDGAYKGATALQSIPIARANVVGGVAGGNWLTVNQTTGKMECGELTKAQYDSANGYTFIGKTTLENRLVSKQDKLTAGSGIGIDNNEVAVKLFDKDKFIVVGTPTITDDGVANFTENTAIKPNLPIIDWSKDWDIEFEYNNIIETGATAISGYDTTYSGLQIGCGYQDGVIILVSNNRTGWQLNTGWKANILPKGKCLIRINHTGNTYNIYVDNILKNTIPSTIMINNNYQMIIGNVYNGTNPIGETNLKQFSITVDDIEVFNGTKTVYQALDKKSPLIYNAQAFTKVGSPTITGDGIASGFSDDNYSKITLPFSIIPSTSTEIIEIEGSFIVPSNPDHPAFVLGSPVTGGKLPTLYVVSGSLLLDFSLYGATDIRSNKAISLNVEYKYKMVLDNSRTWKAYYKVATDNEWIYVGVMPFTSSSASSACEGNLYIGRGYSSDRYFNGSIDLKQFSITVDGKEVFSGALKGTQELANNTDVVHTTGNETIAGDKTFSNKIKLTSGTDQSTNLQYVLGIKPFAEGGDIMWSQAGNVSVGRATMLSGFNSPRTAFWGSVNDIAKTGVIVNGANTTSGGSYILSHRISGSDAELDMIIDGRFYQNQGAYQVLDTSNGVTTTTAQTVSGLKTFSNGLNIGNAKLQYNTATEALDFIFT